MRTIRVAVADDSSFVRKALVRILSTDPRIEVVGTAATGEDLVDHLEAWKADVITLDLVMPGMGGLRALDLIRERRPTPVVVLSTHARSNAPLALEALHRGAVDFIDKQNYSLVDFKALGEVLIEKILEVSGAEMPLPAPAEPPIATRRPTAPTVPIEPPAGPLGPFDLVTIGASTGGPLAVQRVLSDLGPLAGVPIVVVQHMPAGFTAPFAARLDSQLALPVREASDGEPLVRGTAYVAPAGSHLQVERNAARLAARLADEPASTPHRPSVDELFLSAARVVGARAIGILLTGMGRDGAEGMSALNGAGARTVVQDEETSVVFGMPRAALEQGVAHEVLPLGEIGTRARQLLDGA